MASVQIEKLNERQIISVQIGAAAAGFGVQKALERIGNLGSFGDLFKHTTFDAFLSAALVVGWCVNEGNTRKIFKYGLLALAFAGMAENAQYLFQNVLHLTDGGFAWVDYAAYAIGALALAPMIIGGAKWLSIVKRRT